MLGQLKTYRVNVTLNGESWSLFTNGYCGVCRRGTIADYTDKPPADHVIVTMKAALAAPVVSVLANTLHAFVSEPCFECKDARAVPCSNCRGARTERVECSHFDCSNSHECCCNDCDDGTEPCACVGSFAEPGRFDDSGAAYDRRLVGIAIREMPRVETYQIGTFLSPLSDKSENRALCIKAGDEFAMVMERRPTPEQYAELPVLSRSEVPHA